MPPQCAGLMIAIYFSQKRGLFTSLQSVPNATLMADAADSKSGPRKRVWVQVPPSVIWTYGDCRIFCATADATEMVLAELDQGRGILGVFDGFTPNGVDVENEIKWRKDFFRQIGYKQ